MLEELVGDFVQSVAAQGQEFRAHEDRVRELPWWWVGWGGIGGQGVEWGLLEDAEVALALTDVALVGECTQGLADFAE